MHFPSLTFAFADALLYAVQVSIVVPLVVVWWWHHFTVPVRLLSVYVYMVLLALMATRVFLVEGGSGSIAFLTGFNCAKLVLLGPVYYQVLRRPKARQLIMPLIVVSLAGILVVIYYSLPLALSTSRVVQCTLLSGLALLYLDQFSNRAIVPFTTRDVMCLVSIGQLLFSAITITAFSFEYGSHIAMQLNFKQLFIALGSLAFNIFLTLAFLRDHQPAPIMVARRAQV